MAWKDDEFIGGSEGQGYGGPSYEMTVHTVVRPEGIKEI